MYVQTLEGEVTDANQFMDQIDHWHTQLMPEAKGFLGTTAGVTETGTAFVATRFDSEAAARNSQDRDEAKAWWADTETCFRESPRSVETSSVSETVGGALTDAQLVVAIDTTITDQDHHNELREKILGRNEAEVSVTFLDYLDQRVTILVHLRAETEATAAAQNPELSALIAELFSTISTSAGVRLTSPRVYTA